VKPFIMMAGILLLSNPTFAAVFTCNLQKIPPVGVTSDPSSWIRVFTFDTADVPANKTVTFKDLSLSLHSDGRRIRMKVSNSRNESVSSVSSYESEISVQVNEDAVGICLTEDVTKGAISVDPSITD
jgi:hypothetical protein